MFLYKINRQVFPQKTLSTHQVENRTSAGGISGACEAESRPRNAIEAYRGGEAGENKRPSDWIARSSTRKRSSAAIDSDDDDGDDDGGWQSGRWKVEFRLDRRISAGKPRAKVLTKVSQSRSRRQSSRAREREKEREERDLALNADVANFLPCPRKLLLKPAPSSPVPLFRCDRKTQTRFARFDGDRRFVRSIARHWPLSSSMFRSDSFNPEYRTFHVSYTQNSIRFFDVFRSFNLNFTKRYLLIENIRFQYVYWNFVHRVMSKYVKVNVLWIWSFLLNVRFFGDDRFDSISRDSSGVDSVDLTSLERFFYLASKVFFEKK
mgnify:CR=1 FL=1